MGMGLQSGSSNWIGLHRFPLLRQATLRRGNSCLDFDVAWWNSAVQAQVGAGTVQEAGKFLGRQEGVRTCHPQALRRGQKAKRASKNARASSPNLIWAHGWSAELSLGTAERANSNRYMTSQAWRSPVLHSQTAS